MRGAGRIKVRRMILQVASYKPSLSLGSWIVHGVVALLGHCIAKAEAEI